MRKRRLVAAAAVMVVLAGPAAGIGNAARASSSGDPITLHLALDQDMTTLLPMDSNIDDNIWVLDIVYDGLCATTPRRPSRTRTWPRASTPPTTRCGRSRSSPT